MNESPKYIVNPVYDWIFFIGSPIWACALGVLMTHYFAAGYPETVHWWGNEASLSGLLALTQAHLVAVFFRSHGNPEIFKQYPLRFTVVPVVLVGAIYLSSWVMALAAFVTIWWDVYHTSQQNFGLARIYDARSGRGIPEGRWAEKWTHLLFYLCPIIAGSYLMSHVEGLNAFTQVKSIWLSQTLPQLIREHAQQIRFVFLLLAAAALAGLLRFEIRRFKNGYRYPFPKIAIICTTLFCSIFAWGFNKFGDAYFIVNLYHAIQYFAIVWATENKQTGSLLWKIRESYGKLLALCCFFLPPVLIGSWFEFGGNYKLTFTLLIACALLHFWYDGFIWSVRKKSV